jgi:hypothetical protein
VLFRATIMISISSRSRGRWPHMWGTESPAIRKSNLSSVGKNPRNHRAQAALASGWTVPRSHRGPPPAGWTAPRPSGKLRRDESKFLCRSRPGCSCPAWRPRDRDADALVRAVRRGRAARHGTPSRSTPCYDARHPRAGKQMAARARPRPHRGPDRGPMTHEGVKPTSTPNPQGVGHVS